MVLAREFISFTYCKILDLTFVNCVTLVFVPNLDAKSKDEKFNSFPSLCLAESVLACSINTVRNAPSKSLFSTIRLSLRSRVKIGLIAETRSTEGVAIPLRCRKNAFGSICSTWSATGSDLNL